MPANQRLGSFVSQRVSQQIALPTEQQWERAARGLDGREYPWEGDYRAGCANCNESENGIEGGVYVDRTTSAGICPQASEEVVHDLAGNVCEWCLNEHAKPKKIETSGGASRALICYIGQQSGQQGI